MPSEEPPPPHEAPPAPVPDLDFALARIRELIAVTQSNARLTVATSALAERLGRELAGLVKEAGLDDSELMGIIERVRTARDGLLETLKALSSHGR